MATDLPPEVFHIIFEFACTTSSEYVIALPYDPLDPDIVRPRYKALKNFALVHRNWVSFRCSLSIESYLLLRLLKTGRAQRQLLRTVALWSEQSRERFAELLRQDSQLGTAVRDLSYRSQEAHSSSWAFKYPLKSQTPPISNATRTVAELRQLASYLTNPQRLEFRVDYDEIRLILLDKFIFPDVQSLSIRIIDNANQSLPDIVQTFSKDRFPQLQSLHVFLTAVFEISTLPPLHLVRLEIHSCLFLNESFTNLMEATKDTLQDLIFWDNTDFHVRRDDFIAGLNVVGPTLLSLSLSQNYREDVLLGMLTSLRLLYVRGRKYSPSRIQRSYIAPSIIRHLPPSLVDLRLEVHQLYLEELSEAIIGSKMPFPRSLRSLHVITTEPNCREIEGLKDTVVNKWKLDFEVSEIRSE
jgi:hypothetical protein